MKEYGKITYLRLILEKIRRIIQKNLNFKISFKANILKIELEKHKRKTKN